jgi:uncharacterized repeat protein (TIGR03803 family)
MPQLKKTIFYNMKKLYVIILLLSISFGCQQVNAQYTKLLNFASTTSGKNPTGSLISDGTFLYGMTYVGGTDSLGTVFKIKTDGTGYLKLLDFVGVNGKNPNGSLISDGTFLYGMTFAGGTNYNGTLFKIKPDGSGYVKLVDFGSGINGDYPFGSLISDGTFFYGMTSSGGINNGGTIFKIKSDGSNYQDLWDFAGTNGSAPSGSLVSDGTFLYGMTTMGGTNNLGTVFKIKTDGSSFLTLMDFTTSTNGSLFYGSESSLIFDGVFLYGMTPEGGANNLGTIFKIKPDGSGYVSLLDFAGAANGSYPYGGSLFSDGTFLYGMTTGDGTSDIGTIFKIKPDGSGYVKLLTFNGTNGRLPNGSLISDGGFLYGMTREGGTPGDGVIFKLGGAVGIEQVKGESNEISIYPNPTNGFFLIQTNSTEKQIIDLFDINGRHVFSEIVNGTTDLDANSLDNGIYTLTIKNSAGVTNKKLVIAR